MRKYDLCIGGYAGCSNIGDDAILEGYLKGLPTAKRRLRTIVLSGRPRWDSRRFGVRCVGRKNPFLVMACFLRSKVFVCGGGSLLQNATGNLSLFYYLTLLWLARICGCKTELMSSGIGPVRGKFAEHLVIWTLRGCERIEVRDRESEHFLLTRGFDRQRVLLVQDPAMRLELLPASWLFFARKMLGLQKKPYFCVVVRQDCSPRGASLGKLSSALRLFLRECDLTPVFVLFDKRHDVDVTEVVCRSVGGITFYPHEAREALSILSGACFVISMRLHALVFASMAGVEALAISPFEEERKLASFCRAHGMAHLSPAKLTVAALLDQLDELSKGSCNLKD